MINLEIKNLLNQYNQVLESLKSRKLNLKWIEYKKKNIQKERKIISIEKFKKIEIDYNIKFPDDIVFFHINIGNQDTDFHNQINRMTKAKNQSLIEYHYSKSFAEKIIETYLTKTTEEKDKIKDEIPSTTLESYETVLDIFLWEGFEFYNKKTNSFSLSLLQEVYEKLKSNRNLIIENFFTWCHCGGAGGFILNTTRKGFASGEQWGDGLDIIYRGNNYTYKSDFHQKTNRYYLESDVEIIKSELRELKNFSKKRKFLFWVY